MDWAAHALGPYPGWPGALKALVRTLLASPESMYLVWGDNRTFFFNDAYAPILGPRLNIAMGARFEDLWADAYASIEPMFLDALNGRSSRVVDFQVPMARWGAPENTWWTFSFTPAFDDEGRIAGALCVTNETTATVLQAQAERRSAAALKVSEDSLRRAQEAGHIGIFAIDIASGVLTATAEFYKLFGLPPADWISASTIEDLVVSDDALLISNDETRRGSDVKLQVEYRIRRPDTGEIRCIERRAEYELDETGKPVRLVGVVQDVTERRHDQDELAKLNATLEATVVERTQALLLHESIVQSDITAICAFDTEFRLTAFNKAHNDEFFRVNGFYTRIGDVFYDLFVPEQRPVMRAQMARALTGESFTVEEEFGNPDIDTPRWEIHYSPLRDATGRVVGAFHHARDISARLRAQSELETAQEALRQSQKMEAMGQLTGGVAHDFNNLLTPIVGALDMLQRSGLGGERERRLIEGAALSADRARTLVQRLLAFARRQPLQTIAVDVGKLVKDMAGLIASTTGPHIHVVVDTADDLSPARADPNQIEMALLNLAVNARDAMPGGGTLRLSAMSRTIGPGDGADLDPGRYVCLTVTDTGVGMNAATLQRAVEPFFSTKGIGKGTGLGLSMVHGLALQLGGALRIDSQPGRGTEIALWLPESSDAVEPALKPVTTAELSRHGVVLLVDDEVHVRNSTAAMLADLGYQVIESDTAEAALDLIEKGVSADLVVTDHLMSGMTGAELARAIRLHSPDLPILIVSGYAEQDGIPADLPRLTKPFRRDELVNSLAALKV